MSSHEVAIEVGFGLGWDDEGRMLVGRISRVAAQEAHDASRPYCVLCSNPNGIPVLLARVNAEAGYVGYTAFGPDGDPIVFLDYHRFGDVLALRRVHLAVQSAAVSFTVDIQPDGNAKTDLSSKGGSFRQQPSIPVEHRAIPEFTLSPQLSEEGWIDGELSVVYADAPVSDAESGGIEAGAAHWAVPDLTPARPHHLDALFNPGARLRSLGRKTERIWTVQGVKQLGDLTLPTGNVVAMDPYLIDEHAAPFTVTVPPGRYPVYVAHVKEGDQEWTTEAAAKLEITSGLTATWELGLIAGQDTALLGKDAFYGFGVDTGTGAFFDHCACAAFSDLEEILESGDEDADLHPEGLGEFRDTRQGTDANMITYSSGYGDGAYPVWIGRDEGGQVTCFVADMCVVGPAELESPRITPEPRYIEAPHPDRTSWAPTVADAVMKPGATAAYFAEMFQNAVKAQASMKRRFDDMRRRAQAVVEEAAADETL